MIPFAILNSLVSDVKRIFACKLCDDFSGFVDTCGTGKRNRAGALILGNGSIKTKFSFYYIIINNKKPSIRITTNIIHPVEVQSCLLD